MRSKVRKTKILKLRTRRSKRSMKMSSILKRLHGKISNRKISNRKNKTKPFSEPLISEPYNIKFNGVGGNKGVSNMFKHYDNQTLGITDNHSVDAIKNKVYRNLLPKLHNDRKKYGEVINAHNRVMIGRKGK